MLVINIPFTPGVKPVLKARDIILKVDGFEVDIQGDYQDPDYGPLILENLATRRKWAGDEVKLEIVREGKVQEVSYTCLERITVPNSFRMRSSTRIRSISLWEAFFSH